MHKMSKEMQSCVDECLRCYQMCFGMAMTHCLETGGDHVKPKHFRAMISCAEMCRNAAHMMLMKSPQARHICEDCAEACEACAKECDALPDMKDCAAQCRRCAEACRKMAGQKMAA
ncbi:four-helix bundle copper-binding protein [Methylocystis sp. WRRC1]|nr:MULTISPECIES: four-helix bundle copper-binding protein [unclassified Methylocystis]MCC3245610.1 four-helix bundle copper-binding protein [Methylocystis sp. WRRC1]